MSSFVAQRIIFSTHGYSGTELSVLTSLAWHSNHDGVVSGVSVRALALLSRISEKQISRVLKKLISQGAITATPGAGRGHHTVYTLNMDIFNQGKRSVLYKGGVIEVFRDAALVAKGEAAYEKRIQDARGDVLGSERQPNPYITEWAYKPIPHALTQGQPQLRNTLQRRASRARSGDLRRLARSNAARFR